MDVEGHLYPTSCENCGASYQSSDDEGTHIENYRARQANWAMSVCEACYKNGPSLKERIFGDAELVPDSDIDDEPGEMEHFLLGHSR